MNDEKNYLIHPADYALSEIPEEDKAAYIEKRCKDSGVQCGLWNPGETDIKRGVAWLKRAKIWNERAFLAGYANGAKLRATEIIMKTEGQ